MGLRGMPEGELAFEDLDVPADMVVMPPSGFRRGFADLMNAYNSQRVGAGTVAMGIAAGALEHALDWVKTREQFGRPIGEFQGLQWMLADMQVQLTASRLMLYTAARSRGPDGSAFPDPMLAAQAKIFASESGDQNRQRRVADVRRARLRPRPAVRENGARRAHVHHRRRHRAGAAHARRLENARLEAAADARRLRAETILTRRRGVRMHPVFVKAGSGPATPILFVNEANYADASKVLDAREAAFVKATGFQPKAGKHLIVQGPDGGIGGVLFGIEAADAAVKDFFRPAQLVSLLPAGTYRFANAPHDARLAALAFALGSYQFTRYRKSEPREVRLVVPDGVDGDDLTRIAEGVSLARDLINTPSNDMGPQELEDAARKLASQHGAKINVTIGAEIEKSFPLIHAVGMGSPRAPG